jgi:hypothetical protein
VSICSGQQLELHVVSCYQICTYASKKFSAACNPRAWFGTRTIIDLENVNLSTPEPFSIEVLDYFGSPVCLISPSVVTSSPP